MVPEAELEQTEHGLRPKTDGWFVLNARDSHVASRRRPHRDLRLRRRRVEFPQLGINVSVIQPGEFMAMYHWEADQEDFLVLAGEAVLIAEGEERPLRAWDFVHCPADTKHTIVGAGEGPCSCSRSARGTARRQPEWGGYTVDEAARRHGVSVTEDTTEPDAPTRRSRGGASRATATAGCPSSGLHPGEVLARRARRCGQQARGAQLRPRSMNRVRAAQIACEPDVHHLAADAEPRAVRARAVAARSEAALVARHAHEVVVPARDRPAGRWAAQPARHADHHADELQRPPRQVRRR